MRGRGRIKCSASICERTVLVKYSQGDFAHWSFSFGCSLIFFMAIKVVDFLVKTPLTKLTKEPNVDLVLFFTLLSCLAL